MEAKLNELKNRLAEVADLNSAAAVLGWDQATYMPPGGAAARGRQLATLGSLSQAKFTDPAVGRLLEATGIPARTRRPLWASCTEVNSCFPLMT